MDAVILRSWHMHREIKIWARKHRNATHILDAGCGFGQFSYYLHKLNPHYSIIGIDKRASQVCKSNDFFRKRHIGNVYFRSGDVVEFRQEKAFDLVLCVDVMQFVKEDDRAFENFYISLKENGILLMSCPTDVAGPDAPGVISRPGDSELVRNGYNMSALKLKLKALGFRKVRARYTYGKPGQLSWVLCIRFPLTVMRTSKAFLILLPLYYIVMIPVCLILNFMDTHMGHLSGTGFILKAYK
jgi:SAM-dependent methyltransferase